MVLYVNKLLQVVPTARYIWRRYSYHKNTSISDFAYLCEFVVKFGLVLLR